MVLIKTIQILRTMTNSIHVNNTDIENKTDLQEDKFIKNNDKQ